MPECGLLIYPVSETAKDALDVLLSRQEACNTILLAIASALKDHEVDVTETVSDIIAATNEFITVLADTDQTVLELLGFIEETECSECEVCLGCDECLCCGCPYAGKCDGYCYFEQDGFFAKKENIEQSE